MSSICYTNKKIDLSVDNYWQRRGTGEFEYQQQFSVNKGHDQSRVYSNGNTTLVIDGWLYNTTPEQLCKDFDIESLQNLNGDYAMIAETPDHWYVITDVWQTKNIWIFVDPEKEIFSASSSPVGLRQCYGNAIVVPPNTIMQVSKHNFAVSKYPSKIFNLEQKINNYDYVFEALENAVRLRYTDDCVATLSSGYDSGVIACALHQQHQSKFSYSFVLSEDRKVLKQRLDLHQGKILPIQDRMSEVEATELKSVYWQDEVCSEAGECIRRVCLQAHKDHKHTILSGNGGDELYSDYGFFGKQLGTKSFFGGLFPPCLETVWPWHDYKNKNSILVSRTDLLAGYYSVQHKEVLLDVELVQAWLNTTANLKNSNYKGWMREYMIQCDYPYLENVKIGLAGQANQL